VYIKTSVSFIPPLPTCEGRSHIIHYVAEGKKKNHWECHEMIFNSVIVQPIDWCPNWLHCRNYACPICYTFSHCSTALLGPRSPHFWSCKTVHSTARLDKWSAGGRDFYLTKHNTHKRETSNPPDGIRTSNPR